MAICPAPPGHDEVGLIAGYIAGWRPVSVPGEAAGFARAVVARAGPGTRARANALLWAAARLAAFAVPLGLQAAPEVLLHPSVIERFAVSAPGLSPVARRTVRTNADFHAGGSGQLSGELVADGTAAPPGDGGGGRQVC
jgi:hypothetical protein